MSATQRTLLLYSTSACHLCEFAHTLIEPYLDSLAITVEEVDINSSDSLMEQYGILIPVLKFSDGETELGWPFSEDQFLDFAGKTNKD